MLIGAAPFVYAEGEAVPAPAFVPYSVINYHAVEGYDISDIPNRGGSSCNLTAAADTLAWDMSEAIQRIFAVAPAGDRILTYSGAGRDIYPELLTYVTAVFLARNYDYIVENPMSHTLTAEDMAALRRTYWEVLTLTAVFRDTESADGTLDEYGNPIINHTYASQVNIDTIALPELQQPLTEEETARLNFYLSEPMRSALKSALRGSIRSYAVQEEDPLRCAIASNACSLVGLVPYYWGGKSDKLGWDVRWGTPSLLDDGSVMPFGLDCSGLVAWSFVNAVGSPDAQTQIGHGAHRQYLNSVPIDAAEARVGDLVFTMVYDAAIHVGIVVGRNADGELLVCHASGRGYENIVIETMTQSGCNVVCTPKAFYDLYQPTSAE